MENLLDLANKAATEPQRRVIERVTMTAAGMRMPAALVGGALRDALLGVPLTDLDFVVEGDAIEVALALAKDTGSVTVHPKFRTATWHNAAGDFDIATARTERYPHPAALPEVTPATLARDLARRDFACNAVAVQLDDGAMLDPFGGLADIATRRLRVLHHQSFVDDPTRLFRAARYVARLGFALESETARTVAMGVQHVAALTGERMRYDLELIFCDAQPQRALSMLEGWGVFRELGIPVPDSERLNTRFARAHAHADAWKWPHETSHHQQVEVVAGWAALTYNVGSLAATRWLQRVPFNNELRIALGHLGPLGTLSTQMLEGRPPSVLSGLLSHFSGLALGMAWLMEQSEAKRDALHREWHVWRGTRTELTGNDLSALGIPPGPEMGRLLATLRDARLDGRVRTRDDEVALVKGSARLQDSES